MRPPSDSSLACDSTDAFGAYTRTAMDRPPSQPPASLRPWPTILLMLLCAMLYLPGLFALPVVDRDEARFVQATRQMIESGDFVTIRFQQEPRHKKPVGIHWAQASAVRVLRPVAGEQAIWPYRVPSLIGATLAVWLLYFFLRSLAGEGAALLAGALLASSVLLTAEAHLATTDALLLATVVAAQGSLMRRLLQPEQHPLGYSLLFWMAQALGVLIKGPIVPLASILTLAAWRLSGSRFRPLSLLHAWTGLPIALMIVLPWVVAVTRATGGSFFTDALAGDLFPKLISGQESHGFPPGYYLLLVTVTFWPGSLLAGFAFIGAWRRKGDPFTRFLLTWLVPTWVVFELVPTKLPHYVLPLYPALAALTAIAAVHWTTLSGSERVELPRRRSLAIGWVIWSLVTLALAAVIVGLPLALDGRFEPWSLLPVVGALLSVGVGVAIIRRLDAAVAMLMAMVLSSVLVVPPALSLVLPRVEALWPTRGVVRLIESEGQAASASGLPWAAVGDHEPSLVFALGTDMQLLGPARAAEALAAGQMCGVIIERSAREPFEDRGRALGLTVETIGTVRGVLISKGHRVELDVVTRAAAQRAEP